MHSYTLIVIIHYSKSCAVDRDCMWRIVQTRKSIMWGYGHCNYTSWWEKVIAFGLVPLLMNSSFWFLVEYLQRVNVLHYTEEKAEIHVSSCQLFAWSSFFFSLFKLLCLESFPVSWPSIWHHLFLHLIGWYMISPSGPIPLILVRATA